MKDSANYFILGEDQEQFAARPSNMKHDGVSVDKSDEPMSSIRSASEFCRIVQATLPREWS